MSTIDALFKKLRAEGRKALMPFLTAGDPDLPFTARAIAELARRGAHLCEIGIPYSDPIADGPVIQASYTRALANHVKLAGIFDMLYGLRHLDMPRLTMVSYAIVLRHSPRRYLDEVKAAGVAGLIVPDLPVEESVELARLCRAADLSLVQLVAPTTPRERALKIAENSTGFLYYVSVTGITGERTAVPQQTIDNVSWLRERTPLPICIGFGIGQPEHVRLLAPVADGLIVGSALVRRIAAAAERPGDKALADKTIADIGDFAASLLAALPNP